MRTRPGPGWGRAFLSSSVLIGIDIRGIRMMFFAMAISTQYDALANLFHDVAYRMAVSNKSG